MTTTNKTINQKLDNILSMLESMDSRIIALEESNKVSKAKTTSKKTTSSKKKTATKSTKSNDFDYALYKKTAKKLGVWREDLGKVCKADRQKVYDAMGL